MNNVLTINRKMLLIYVMGIILVCIVATGKLAYIMIFKSEYYTEKALDVQERQRKIKAPRGKILDRNGKVIASNKTVCTISVIYNQVKEPEKVIKMLASELQMEEKDVRKKVEKISSREKIKSNVDKKTGDKIREYNLSGVKVDEDYKRYYPYESLASKVLGFTGADNQGIIGLEVKYEKYLKGMDGLILTPTDTRGIEMENALEQREEPVPGNNLTTTIDVNIQQYAEQIAYNTLEAKGANYVSIIVMNPNNGEVLAMVNAPEFNLNEPYKLNYEISGEDKKKKKQDLLNKMWRNQCINDTYEPGSTFKVVTATAALENNVVTLDSRFSCPGFRIVDDRKIRCHKTTGHGAETFLQGTMNSCNPVFIDVGLKVGVKKFYKELDKLGLLQKTGIDIPGEAGTIIHQIKNVGNVELATMSFGQSFQITPVQYLVAASAVVNGGKLVTPHFALKAENVEGDLVEKFGYKEKKGVVSKETSDTMKYVLEKVISEGTGSKGQVEGYKVGGKTATSQKLPRGSGRYIASFMGFAPADNPKVIAMAIIDEPEGIYYGGQVAAPVISELYRNILPYLLEEKEQGE
ncbi:peptidoglycan glycosyltransferase [Eubacterium sp. AF15-50]|uniref:Peptidoglycan glycosyltransferase n=3 Tax=Eubacterium TaxID=1730 RepID=A0ABR7F2B3_9FIRM|nr:MULTISPECIES: penicillin-binding transpeptidase domain-containing protein [Eubacterium]MBC5666900.1 peptidoglycan glycosyltransferase [Eubacterium segne]RHR73731.1 peptidoglycan glycosyltransferase [Eubacterium sp. AF16-48]RHR81408.1 peptidoglycan glycosyltransferase [Eubacterium sp. AF15-50]